MNHLRILKNTGKVSLAILISITIFALMCVGVVGGLLGIVFFTICLVEHTVATIVLILLGIFVGSYIYSYIKEKYGV